MERESFPGNPVSRPPLRTFRVFLFDHSFEDVEAHLVFNNAHRDDQDNSNLIFRKYYDNDVRTELVAEFTPNSWLYYKERT